MTGPGRPLPRLGYRPILGRLLSRLAPIVTRQDEIDEAGDARPLTGTFLRPEAGSAPERPIYTGGVPSEAPSPYRMADLSVGPDGVAVGRAPVSGRFGIEENLRRAPYTNDPTPKPSQRLDFEQSQADLAELERRRDDPTLPPDTRATYDAAVTNLRQQIDLGRRFGMGGTGASPVAEFGWNALDAATLGLTGSAYQREMARRAEAGSLVSREDVTALLGHPARSATVPQPGGLGVAGGLAGGIAAFAAGEGALKAGTMALRGTRFGALARPAEAYFKAAYTPIDPAVASWAGGPVLPRSAVGYGLRKLVQGSFQGAPVGAVMDAARARLEGRDVGEGVVQGGMYGAMLGGLMEASGLPSTLWGRGAPWEYARAISADDALARATMNPFHQPLSAPDTPEGKPLWPEDGGMPPTGPEPPAMGTQGVLKSQPPEPGLQTAPTREGRPDISTTQETMVPPRRPLTPEFEDRYLPNLAPDEVAFLRSPAVREMYDRAAAITPESVALPPEAREPFIAGLAAEMATPATRGFASPEEFVKEMGFAPNTRATRPSGEPRVFTYVTGGPGSGKTSQVTRRILETRPWTYLVDPDQPAKRHPGWAQYGPVAREALHEDAVETSDRMLADLMERGEDIVFSKIGLNDAFNRKLVARAREAGYVVQWITADLPADVATVRATRRMLDPAKDGHVVNPAYILKHVANRPAKAFLKDRRLADASAHLQMGIAPGQEPTILSRTGRLYGFDERPADAGGATGVRAAGPDVRPGYGRESGPAGREAGAEPPAPRAAPSPRQVGPDLSSEAGFFGEQFLPANLRTQLEALRASGQRLPETLDELQAMVAGMRDAEGRPQFDDLRARIDQLPPELRQAPTDLLDRASALHGRISEATGTLRDRVAPAALIGGLAAGGLAGAAAAGLLPDDTSPTGRGIAAVAAFTAGLLAGTAGGAMVARSFGRGTARRMEFPDLPVRVPPPEVEVVTRPDPGPAPRMEPEPEPRPEPVAATGPKPGEVIQGGFPSGKEAGELVKELAAQGQRAEVRRQKDGTFSVVAKGAKQASTAVAKVEQTELLPATLENGLPYTPGASPEQNRPAKTDPGWALAADPQGRFYSRLGRALERLPAQRHTAADWLKQLESAKGFSKLEYEAVLKPVLEKIAAGDPSLKVFPWLLGHLEGPPGGAWTQPELDAAAAVWPTMKLTPEALLALAQKNRFQLTTVRLGSDKQTDPQAGPPPPRETDPLGFATTFKEWQDSQNVTQHEAWTDHVIELAEAKDEAEQQYEREYRYLVNLFDNAPDGVPGWSSLDTDNLDEAIRENYKIREKATEVWQEAWEDTDVSDAAREAVLEDTKSHADQHEAVTGARMNALLGTEAWPEDYRSEFDEDSQRYVLYDGDGEEVARFRDHWTLWEESVDLDREIEDLVVEKADELRDEVMPSLDDVIRYAEDAAEVHETYQAAESEHYQAENEMDEDSIREWLEGEGHDLPDPDAERPDPATYGLAAGSFTGIEVGDSPLHGGRVLYAVGEPATRDRPIGAPVYVDGKYLTPEESREFVRNRREMRQDFTALEWNQRELSPYGVRNLPAWDGSRQQDFTGEQTLFRAWLTNERETRTSAELDRRNTERTVFFPWASRELTGAERTELRRAEVEGGAPGGVDAMRRIGGLLTSDERRLLKSAIHDDPSGMDGSVFNLIIGRDAFPEDLRLVPYRDLDRNQSRGFYVEGAGLDGEGRYPHAYGATPGEAWASFFAIYDKPSQSAQTYGEWRRRDYNYREIDRRLAPFEAVSDPAGPDPVRQWYIDNTYMPDGDYDPAAHGMTRGPDGRLLRSAFDGGLAVPPHEVGEVVYDETGKYWGPNEYRHLSPGVLDTENWAPGTPTLDLVAPPPPVEGAIPTRAIPGPARDPATLFEPPEGSEGSAQYSGYIAPPGPGMSRPLDYREVLTVIPPRLNPLEPEGAASYQTGHFGGRPDVHHMLRVADYETHETGERDFLTWGQEGQGDLAKDISEKAEETGLLNPEAARRAAMRRRTYRTERVNAADIPDLVAKANEEFRIADTAFDVVNEQVQKHFSAWRQQNAPGKSDTDAGLAYIATPEGGPMNARLEAAYAAKLAAQTKQARMDALDRLARQQHAGGSTAVEVEAVENADAVAATLFRTQTVVGEFAMKRLLLEWAERGRGTLIGWSNGAMLKTRWSKDFRPLYDDAMPTFARYYLDRLLGKEMSARITLYNKGGSGDNAGNGWRLRIPKDIADEVRRRIQQNGIELMSLTPLPLVLMAATMNEAQQDEATRDLLRLVKGAGLVAAGGLALYGAAKGVRRLRRFRTRPELPHTSVEADAVARVEPEALPVEKRASEGRVGRGKVPRLTEKEVSRLGLPPHLEKEVVQAVTDQRGLVGGPEVVSNDEMLRRAQAELDVGEGALVDLDPTRATAPQIIAIASLAGMKKRTADLFWQRSIDPSLSASEQRANAKQAERMDEDFLALMTGSMRGSSEAGRTLNAMKLLANLRPDPDYWWRRTMKMLDRPLTPEERVKIDTFLKNDQRAELVQYLARLKKTGIPSQIVTLLNAGLFTRPAARALDLISSGGNLLLENGVNAPGRVLLDRLVAMATGARTATLPGTLQIQGIGRGMYHGLQAAAKSMGWHAVGEAPWGEKWSAWVDYMRNVEMTPEMLARYDLPHLTNIDLFSLSRNPEAPLNVVMDAIQKTIYRTLGFSDRILVGAAYEGAVADLAMARAIAEKAPHPKTRAEELIANPPDDLRFDAMLMASRITFNNEEAMARLSKLVMRAPGDALRKVEGPVGELSGDLADAGMRFQFPVVRTVANITARALDYIPPIGTARGFYNLWSAFRSGLEPGLRSRKQRVAVEVLSRNLTGSALVALGAYLYQQGLMTGAASTDPTERNLATGIGQTPNSLLWNGEWVPIGRLPPFGTLLAVGATLAQIAERRDKAGGKLGFGAGAAFAVGRAILDQPFLTGSRSALDALQDPVTRSENYLEQQVGRVVPTVVAEMAAADGLARDVNGPLDALKARLPGLRDDLPVQVTGYGDPIQGRTGLANRLFNPFAGSPDKRVGDPVLARSYDLGYIPGRVARDRATPTTPQESPEEYARRAAFVGGLRKTMVGRGMATHPVFTDPVYLDQLARQVMQVDPDYAGLTLNEAKRKLQQTFVRETSEGISPHEDPALVPRAFGGQR